MNKTFTLLKCIMVLCFFAGGTAFAQIVVTNNSNSGPGSLRQAVTDATAGQTITFDPLTNLAEISVTGSEIVINKNLIITGNAGVLPTRISGNEQTRILSITNNANVTISGITFREGLSADTGGAISVAAGATLTLNNCIVDDNEAEGNAAAQGGGGIYCAGTLNLLGCTISNNTASGTAGSGGGILIGAGGTLTAGIGNDVNNTPTVISNNTANRAGGGIEGIAGTDATVTMITLNSVELNENETGSNPGNGGGLHITGAGNVTINGGTVEGNIAASEGGGLWNGAGTMTVTDTEISGNTASGNDATNGGGGIYNLNGGTLTINNATITGNMANGTAGSGGGILADIGSTLNITGGVISNNTAKRAGGGVEYNSSADMQGTVNFTDVDFTGNSIESPASPGNGGAFHITGPGSATFTGGEISGNTAVQGGGLWNASGTLTLNQVQIFNNTATGAAATDGGGGIYNVSGTLSITGSFITNNRATGTNGSGGGIFSADGTATLTNTQITENSANRAGGGIEVVAGTYTLTNTNITENDVDGGAGTANPGNGGGVHISGASVFTINGGSVTENSAAREGGGLWNQTGSTMNVNGVALDDNTAAGDFTHDGGGAIFNNGGTLNVTASTLSNNTATGSTGRGGAIHVNEGTATITRSTISGNEAEGFGGGIYTNTSTTASFNACTIAFNTGLNGGGLYSAGTTTLKNTLLAENEAGTGSNINIGDSQIISDGYNFIQDDEEGALEFNEADKTGTTELPLDAGLLPLDDNGGNTLTHSFTCPSPVADAGDSSTFPDQRGMMIFGSRRDIGAFEAQEVCSELSVNDALAAGKSVIYPNPSVNGIFNLQLHTNIGDGAAINVYEIGTGKLVKQTVTAGMQMQLDMTAYAAGTYVLQITSNKTTETHKIIVGK